MCRSTPHPPPPNQNGTMAKDACCVGKLYWRREHALGEMTAVRLMCTAGTFTGCVDNVKSEQMTNHFGKTNKVYETTKGEQITQAGKSDKRWIRLHKLFTDTVGCYKIQA